MKHLKTYEKFFNADYKLNNESVKYGKVKPDDDYDIDVVTRDSIHQYENCDGVTYELSRGGDDRIVYIEEVENTPENMFYDDQIERYVQYIEDGGILQSFPVQSGKKAYNLEDMLNYIDDEDDGFDIMHSLFKSNPWDKDPKPENEKMYELYMARGGYWQITSEPDLYGFFNEPCVDLKDIRTIEDLHEVYYDYSDEKPDEDDDYYEEWEQRMNSFDEDILRGMEDIIKYFEDEEEYTLTDFNHRFEALKRMGKERIYVEVM